MFAKFGRFLFVFFFWSAIAWHDGLKKTWHDAVEFIKNGIDHGHR